MKVKKTDGSDGFKPIEITFTLESLKEVNALFFLFNYAPLCDAISGSGMKCEQVRKILREECQYPDMDFDSLCHKVASHSAVAKHYGGIHNYQS